MARHAPLMLIESSQSAFMQESPPSSGRGDALIRINISRNTLIAFLLSLFIHALIFFTVPKIEFDTASAPPRQTIEVSLAPPKPVKPLVVPEIPVPKANPKPTEKAKPKVAKVITQKSNTSAKPVFTVPDEVTPIAKPASEPVLPKEDFPTDMASYVRAKQAQRQAAESDAARQNAEASARERGPSEAQMREERIKRNLQTGTNGIFEITNLSSRHGGFAFRGWTNDYSSSRRQFFEVEASSGQDIRLVMVKRMIGLIREHYQGDFNWDSHRLARVVILSAKPEDNAGLEDFMMMEFFGANYRNVN